MAAAWPLLPPSVLNGVMIPFCQTKPRQMRLVPNEQKFSLLGSVTEVSAAPATCIALFRLANDSLFAPPSVPRSVIAP